MGWFRGHIKTGSRLALAALAIQFVLAFGHVHPARAQTTKPASPSYIELVAAAIEAENSFSVTQEAPADDHDRRPHPPLTDTCGVCAVMAMAASVLLGTSPILHLPEAVSFLCRATDEGFAHLDTSHGPFQPRGPPLS